jgi:tetratricopeptide (TPR) repeat protein
MVRSMVCRCWHLILVFWCLSSESWAQFDELASSKQVPQASSQQELDEYIEILDADTPLSKVQTIQAFLQHYPASNFQAIVYQFLMLAYKELGDSRGLIDSAEKALNVQPDNLNTLLTLADVLPNGVSGNSPEDRRRLAQAEHCARRVFEGIEQIKLPRTMPRQRWEVLSREMESTAYEALGHVASKRGEWRDAVAQFEKAVKQTPNPRGRQFYRLGVAYMLAGSDQSALAALHQAVELGPDEIRQMASAVLKRIDAARNPVESGVRNGARRAVP